MSSGRKQLRFEQRDDQLYGVFEGPRITNVNDLRAIGDELFEVLETRKPPVLILDFSRVNYLPSAMLGKLAAVRAAVQRNGGRLQLCGLRGSVAQLFKATRLDRLFEILESPEGQTPSPERPPAS